MFSHSINNEISLLKKYQNKLNENKNKIKIKDIILHLISLLFFFFFNFFILKKKKKKKNYKKNILLYNYIIYYLLFYLFKTFKYFISL